MIEWRSCEWSTCVFSRGSISKVLALMQELFRSDSLESIRNGGVSVELYLRRGTGVGVVGGIGDVFTRSTARYPLPDLSIDR